MRRPTSRPTYTPPPPAPADEYTFDNFADVFRFVAGEVRSAKRTYTAISKRAHVCPSTVSNLASGKTQYPRYSTIVGILDALGYEQVTRRRS
jgi:hypothetical protein